MSKKKKVAPSKQLVKEIKRCFTYNPHQKMSFGDLKSKLQLKHSKPEIVSVLRLLEDQRFIRHEGKGRFRLHKNARNPGKRDKTTIGHVDMTMSGSAYIVSNEIEDDIFVVAKNLGSAFHGDLVEISYYYPRNRRRPEGRVVKIKERASEVFIGPITHFKKYSIVLVEKRNVALEIFVDPSELMGAQSGEMVVVRVTNWPKRDGQSPIGKVTEVLGSDASNDVRMKSILVNNGFPLEFPEAVLDETAQMNTEIQAAEIASRKDMRDVLCFTIDPKDAKDFDDAISIKHLKGEELEIGVHIADVSHYVLPDTALDKEAYQRSTSVYLVDRVLPMLPEKISNELCSLRPNEDKLCFSVLFTFGKDKKLKSTWIGRTAIHSDQRLTYEEAQEILDGKQDDLKTDLDLINQIAKTLRKERFNSGSINFKTDEVRFELDEKGHPVGAYVKETGASNHLIEEYMLLANQAVALFINEKKLAPALPFVYRVHDLPDEDRLHDIAILASELGLNIDVTSPERVAIAFNQITSKAEQDPAFGILSHLAIRSMAKAEYSTDNIGHYGLGFSDYTHFTSPIRRYSDVLVHRILFENLDGKEKRVNKAKLDDKCAHISRQERKAVRAERESTKLKQVEYAEKFVGETTEGLVSGIIERGVFVVVLDSRSEGLISFDQFNERFQLGDSGVTAVGQNSGRKIRIGDTIPVKISKVDLNRVQIDFELIDA